MLSGVSLGIRWPDVRAPPAYPSPACGRVSRTMKNLRTAGPCFRGRVRGRRFLCACFGDICSGGMAQSAAEPVIWVTGRGRPTFSYGAVLKLIRIIESAGLEELWPDFLRAYRKPTQHIRLLCHSDDDSRSGRRRFC